MSNPFEDLKAHIDARLDSIESRIARMQPDAPEQDAIDIKAAAVLLGRTITAVHHLVHQRAIPSSKKGGRLYFSRKALSEWMLGHARKTVGEMATAARTGRK